MEFSIDGILGLIGLVYNNSDAYATNSEQLHELLKKVKLFEIPLQQLKSYPEMTVGTSAQIQNLYIIMKEIQMYLCKFKDRNKVQNFFTALIVEKEIKKFNMRLDEIKACINFELDVSNHFIFHSFNQKSQDFNSQMECLVEEMKSKNVSDIKYWSCILEQMLEKKISSYMEKYDEKIYLMENFNVDEKLYLMEQNIQNQILYLHDMIHEIKNSDLKNDIIKPRENNTIVENEKKKISKNKKSLVLSEIQKYSNLVIECSNNVILKNHFKLILLIYLLNDTPGHFMFDGQSIIKIKSCVNVFQYKILLPNYKKILVINVPEEFIETFLYKKGFALYVIQNDDYHDTNLSKIPFEIKEYYHVLV